MICRICEHDKVSLAIDFGKHPIAHGLKQSQSESNDTYQLQLGCCKSCGFMQIMQPISPSVLYQNYFTISAWKNQPHVKSFIRVLQNLAGENIDHTILDIGCNDGSFLVELKKMGYTNVYGIEPTEDASTLSEEKGLNVHKGFFSEDLANSYYGRNHFDIITTRQVLEHIVDLDDFLKGIQVCLKDDGVLVIEVPDAELNLTYLDYALWEEHVNYFTLETLGSLLKKHSFNIIHHETTLFSGKALILYCQKSRRKYSSPVYCFNDQKSIENYIDKWVHYKQGFTDFLLSIEVPIAMYGCGARSTNFLNFLQLNEVVECYIDDQVEKQNLYVPGGDLLVSPWDSEKFKKYFFLLGVNAENEHKVMQKRGLTKNNCISIAPPSTYLPDFWSEMIYD